MNYLKLVLIFILFLLFSGQIWADSYSFRNEKEVQTHLMGEWESYDYTFNPDKPFTGSAEEKKEFEQTLSVLKSSLPVFKYIFLKNGKFKRETISHQEINSEPRKGKGKWKLNQGGDYLHIKMKDGEQELFKVLIITSEKMETLSEDLDMKVIIFWQKTP